MLSKEIWIIGFILLVIILWSPWITTDFATRIVSEKFNAQWFGIMDGCVLSCNGCGIKGVQRMPFGVKVNIVYLCGVQPSNAQPNQRTDIIFVSFLGTVHGLKKSFVS